MLPEDLAPGSPTLWLGLPASKHLGADEVYRFLDLNPRDNDKVNLEEGPRICIFMSSPGDSDAHEGLEVITLDLSAERIYDSGFQLVCSIMYITEKLWLISIFVTQIISSTHVRISLK